MQTINANNGYFKMPNQLMDEDYYNTAVMRLRE